MSLLDNRSLIKQFDHNNYLSHILETPEQIFSGYELAEQTIIPALYAQAKQVVILTSGELFPVALALEALMIPYARVPVICSSDYQLPHWVSSETLVIAIDYNGTHEAVLTAYQEAAKRRARLISLGLESELARETRRRRAVHLTISYGAPARATFPYLFSCVAGVLKKLDFVELKAITLEEASVLCQSLLENIGPEVATYRNTSKQLAERAIGRQSLIIGSGPLIGMAKKWQIDFCASGKLVSTASTLGEFSDTIINGLGQHTKLTDAPLVIMLQSRYDHPRNKLQQTLIYQVAQSQKFIYEQVFMHPSGSLFGELLLCGLMGEMTGYYLAWLQQRDPSELAVTSYVKEHLTLEAPQD